uniref:Glycosyltransferase family 92 protein n=1 Tax=Bursaphelenchus xylophilus TaxID=6326 RepID=A0A1I7RWI9_BURXY
MCIRRRLESPFIALRRLVAAGDLVRCKVIASTFYVVDDSERWYCHIRNSDGEMLRVRAHFRLIWQRAWDARRTFYNPYLITCALPNDFTIYKGATVMLRGKKCPNGNDTFIDVNLVSKAREMERHKRYMAAKPVEIGENGRKIGKILETMARNRYDRVKLEDKQAALNEDEAKISIKQIDIAPSPLKIAVCVKGMDFFEDKTYDLTEWLLFQFKLGADSVTLYVYHLPERTLRMLNEVAREYDLRLIHLDLPGNTTLSDHQQHDYIWNNHYQKRRNELIPYNDCFYAYSHTHDYVLIVDTDEIVVPVEEENWNDMISKFIRGFRQNATSLSARNVFKFPRKGDGVGMSGRRTRASIAQDKGVTGKSFIRWASFQEMHQV